MPGENGHSQKAIELADALLPPDDPKMRGARTLVQDMLRTLDDHGIRGIPLSREVCEAYQIVAARLLGSKHERVQASALRSLTAAAAYNLERYAAADKMARLANGEATDVAEHRGYIKFIGMPESELR